MLAAETRVARFRPRAFSRAALSERVSEVTRTRYYFPWSNQQRDFASFDAVETIHKPRTALSLYTIERRTNQQARLARATARRCVSMAVSRAGRRTLCTLVPITATAPRARVGRPS